MLTTIAYFSFESISLVILLPSEGFVISGVCPEHMVEFHVVDLISSLSLESLVNKGELLLGAQKLNIVEDGAETGHGDEAGSGAVLVLEEGLDQQSAESDLLGQSGEEGIECLFFFVVQNVLRINDGRSVERLKSLSGVLFKILLGEDVINLLVKVDVVHEGGVVGDHVEVLKGVVLRDGQVNLLDVQDVTELLAGHVALAENVVILEELKKSNSVFLALVHNFFHEAGVLLGSIEIGPFLNVSGFGTGEGSVNSVLEAVGVLQELSVTDLSVEFSVLGGNTLDLLFAELVSEQDKDLTELLLRHLEMLVAIPILEEGLGVESVLADHLGETAEDGLDLRRLVLGGGGASVESLGTGVVEWLVDVFLESLLGEDLINTVAEVSPADVITGLGGLEAFADHVEFSI